MPVVAVRHHLREREAALAMGIEGGGSVSPLGTAGAFEAIIALFPVRHHGGEAGARRRGAGLLLCAPAAEAGVAPAVAVAVPVAIVGGEAEEGAAPEDGGNLAEVVTEMMIGVDVAEGEGTTIGALSPRAARRYGWAGLTRSQKRMTSSNSLKTVVL